jgi:uncharacterized protein
MISVFLSLYRFFSKKPLLFALGITGVVGVALWFALQLRLEEDISKSVPDSEEQLGRIINESRLTNKLIIHIYAADTSSAPETDLLTGFAAELSDSLRSARLSGFVEQAAIGSGESLVAEMMDLFYAHTPVFLAPEDYPKIDSLIRPEQIDRSLEKNFNTLVSPAGFAMKPYILRDPLGISALALAKLRHFQIEEGYEIVDGYIFANGRRDLMLFLDPVNSPSETGRNAVFFSQLDQLIEALSAKRNHTVKAGYFGAAAMAVGNAEQIKRDISLTVTIAMVIILLFTGWFFRKVSIPFISFLPALFGGIIALALIFLTRGSMSTIALGIGSVLLGIIVDYALYFYSVYRSKGDIERVVKDLSQSIIMCSATSAAAFFSLLFVKSEVLRDLGLFAGFSILGAALFALLILPQIARLQQPGHTVSNRNPVLRLASRPFESSRPLLLVLLLLTLLFAWFSKKAAFETDMYSINYMPEKLKAEEKSLDRINGAALRSVYLVSTGTTMNEALSVNEKVMKRIRGLKSQGIINRFTNPGMVWVSDSAQEARIRMWKEYWTRERLDGVKNAVAVSSARYGFAPDAFATFLQTLNSEPGIPDSSEMAPLKTLILNDMVTRSGDLTMVVSLVRVRPGDRHRVPELFAGIPGSVVIDRQEITHRLVGDIRVDFDLLVKLSMLFVTLLLVVSFGRIETGLIAAVPMLLSWLWTLGFVGLTGIKFNIINIIVSTFVFGLGVDYSILMIRGLLLEYKVGQPERLSYKTSILLSGFTTLVGVGVLILAKHPSLHSIALVSVMGLTAVILLSYTLVPLFFTWLVRKNGRPRVLPVIFSDVLTTIVVFGIFIGGSLLLNLLLAVVILLPVSVWKKKAIMHRAMAFCSKLPVYAMVHIRKQVINESGEDFSRPAMIISNHQSHIDLMLLLMLDPKIIVLTTKWVWNNPIYAMVIRFLDFYPVMEGHGDLTEKLRESVRHGYSILVFPEGSRSADATIRRFHKGAFLMAEQLGLDLLPVFIHGASDCMTKGENHLRGGSVTVKIYPRVKPGDAAYGADYHERTRNMLRFYRTEWARIREALETPDYFRIKLIRNYIYKGPVLEWYTRIKLKLENNYDIYDRYVPRNAVVTDIGCGYGYLSYMLGFVSSKRHILGIDYDADKIRLAQHCISANEHIRFEAADAAEYPFKPADVFIFSDMLHYLPTEKQEALLLRCIGLLNPGGKILIRDADRDMDRRHRRTRLTEFFSTRTGFNKSDHLNLYFFSGVMIQALAGRCGMEVEVINQSALTSNVLYVLQKQS